MNDTPTITFDQAVSHLTPETVIFDGIDFYNCEILEKGKPSEHLKIGNLKFYRKNNEAVSVTAFNGLSFKDEANKYFYQIFAIKTIK